MVMAACASQSTPVNDQAACGLPQLFTPPIVCPIPKEKTRQLKIDRHENTCFDIEREPGTQGGLRIPRQTVCPPFGLRG
ncbi:MAG: hypothetical protein KIS79_04020 [Burkholderiales bacterium]|nr:hypothetical protein [Burkholderiales bacterium]